MRLSAGLRLPRHWSTKEHPLRVSFWRHGDFFNVPNKYWEVQIDSFEWTTLFDLEIDWSSRQDHAGLNVSITLLGIFFAAQVYDSRHWNDEAGRFYEADEDEGWDSYRHPELLETEGYKKAAAYLQTRADTRRQADDPTEILRRLVMTCERMK